MTDQFENYYNFTFDKINASDNSTYPSFLTTIENVSNGFVFIEEFSRFHPYIQELPSLEEDPSYNEMYPWTLIAQRIYYGLLNKAWNKTYPTLKGKISFDYDNDSYNAAIGKPWGNIPNIFINGSEGKRINESVDEYTVDFYINQTYNGSVESYNVIGQINGTDTSKTVLIGCLYDSVHNQGTVDAGIGMAMVLAIAKYMKKLETDYNIKPKYNLKFIGYAGEEAGLLGAFYYEATHYNTENITYIIDLNQLCYNQSDVPSVLNVVSNRIFLKYVMGTINEITDYTARAEDGTELDTLWTPAGSVSDELVFAQARLYRGKYAFLFKYKTIMFLKDLGWYRHHRDGMDHTEGDSMKYYNEADVKLTSELVLNTTKFFTVDPDCWFDGNPTFTLIDNTNDNYVNYDEINVSYTIKTMMPNDHVSVRLVLHPKFQLLHPCYSLLYRLRAEKEYVLTPDGITDYISITLPIHYPKGKYRAELYLCNSTGDVLLDCIHLISVDMAIDGLEYVQMLREEMFIDILEEISPFLGDIYESLGIDVIEWIKRLPDLRDKRIRDSLIDFLGFYLFRDDKCSGIFDMHPPNQPPNQPDKPTGETNVEAGQIYWYTTKATDLDAGDKIRFQWKWSIFDIVPNPWSINKYDSGEYHNEPHIFSPGEKEIKVRAKNPRSANVFSVWSDPLSVIAENGCFFNIITSHSNQNNINNPDIQNSFNPNVVVVGEDVLYQGFSYGLGESPSYTYYFNGEHTRSSQDPNYNYSFSETGTKYVNLTVDSENETVYYNTTIVVVNISACFNMSKLGAQPNQTIYFNDTSISNKTINGWFWSFGDGNTSYSQNTSHNFSNTGVYNVSLNVTDIDDETACFWQIVYVETNPPEIIDVVHTPIPGVLGCNISLFAEVYDNSECGVGKVNFSVVYPNGTVGDFTMYESDDSMYDYEFVFNDTWQVGWYYYTVWVSDYANNSNNFTGCGFQVAPAFGYTTLGNNSQNIDDRITGSNFTVLVNGTADSVTAFIQSNLSTAPKIKCMIYKMSDSTLMGTTEEKIINTGEEPDWVTFNFTTTKPNLTTGVDYVLVCWSNDTCNLYYDDTSDVSSGRYKNYSYGVPPSPSITWDGNESRLYSIYCSYTTVPFVKNVSVSPGVVGFGFNTTITTVVENYYVPVEEITVNITYPDNSTVNVSMTELDSDTFCYVFDDAWSVGQYNFSVWFVDTLGGNCSSTSNSSSTAHSFNVSSLATVSVCTEKDSYDGDDIISLTDPPGGGSSSEVGYELLDGGKVLHIWNRYDDYYFNTSNGMQFTNHYNNYWSHNVLMLGYYNNDQWNLIYRVDELSGFNKDIDTDDETYVNATLWKDLTYKGYNFHLAIRYHLGVEDKELTIIPYIKNLGQAITYTLGFAWELKDIQVNMTPSGDYIEINGTTYYLNQSLDETYKNMNQPCFYIREDISSDRSESLYLCWNDSLDYLVKVKSREGQYNAPVTLGIKIGTLAVGQEKYTSLFWHDASEITYYFNSYSIGETWATNPGYMVDGSTSTYASTTSNGDVELCNGNSCSGLYLGEIIKVELRVFGYYTGNQRDIILTPVFGGTTHGGHYAYGTTTTPSWSQWFDITADPFFTPPWNWTKVHNLDCDVEAKSGFSFFTLYCSKVEIRVTYIPISNSIISNPYPADGSTGISITPTLNITVSDPDGDSMSITWFSNSSGNWQIFGTNNSVSNGTYHQTMTNASVNGQWWYWKVNVTDGASSVESSVYKFYTGYQSKINNTGSTNIKGYLLIQVRYYNETFQSWVVADDTINETSPRTILWADPGGIPGQNILALDTIFNGLMSTSDLSGYGNGMYRVYACFRDPDGNVLVFDDDSLLEAWYEFIVTFD